MVEQTAAASARLCVETLIIYPIHKYSQQPPLRGCVLKPLKSQHRLEEGKQPPLRGCVLKPAKMKIIHNFYCAAASARLCVETISLTSSASCTCAAASARLCVETIF